MDNEYLKKEYMDVVMGVVDAVHGGG
jgi:hypothetical protein